MLLTEITNCRRRLYELQKLYVTAYDKWSEFVNPYLFWNQDTDIYILHCEKKEFFQRCIDIRKGPSASKYELQMYQTWLNELNQLFDDKTKLFEQVNAYKAYLSRLEEKASNESVEISLIASFL